jgi:hypothetical protein
MIRKLQVNPFIVQYVNVAQDGSSAPRKAMKHQIPTVARIRNSDIKFDFDENKSNNVENGGSKSCTEVGE